MTAKTGYDFVLWGVPRFHRSGSFQTTQGQDNRKESLLEETLNGALAPVLQAAAEPRIVMEPAAAIH